MNRSYRSRVPVHLVFAADDVLRTRTALVGATIDAPRVNRLRKVDRVVAVGGEHLEPGLLNGRRRGNAPAYDRKVFLNAVNQLDFLRGVGRGDEVELAATGGQQQQDQRAAGRDRTAPGTTRNLMADHLLGDGQLAKPSDRGGCEPKVPGGAKTEAKTMLANQAKSRGSQERPLAIVAQIWETMIRMSQADCRFIWTICLVVALAVAGCCGGGPNHKCDFTPPNVPGNDGGTDGPMLCGTAVCEGGKVCCYKKAPPLALCIDPASFKELACETMDLPCFTPDECPDGMTCCLALQTLTVTCQPQILCMGDGVNTLRACGSELDCPFTAPTCSVVGQANGKDFKVCGAGP